MAYEELCRYVMTVCNVVGVDEICNGCLQGRRRRRNAEVGTLCSDLGQFNSFTASRLLAATPEFD